VLSVAAGPLEGWEYLSFFVGLIGAAEDQKSKKCVRVFVVYSQWGVGKNKTTRSRKENGPHGQ
jgi:hypothetical protein